jgi:hypothetical protein
MAASRPALLLAMFAAANIISAVRGSPLPRAPHHDSQSTTRARPVPQSRSDVIASPATSFSTGGPLRAPLRSLSWCSVGRRRMKIEDTMSMLTSPRAGTPEPRRPEEAEPLAGLPEEEEEASAPAHALSAGLHSLEEAPVLTNAQNLARYDLNRDGFLDSVEKTIMHYDTNHDGKFSVTEVKAIITDLNMKKKETKQAKVVSVVLFGALLAVCLMNFLTTMWSINLMRDQEQGDSGLLTVAGTDTVVQVASSDMGVGPDGSLVTRINGATSSTTIRTSQQMIEHSLTSAIPDHYLAELSYFWQTKDGIEEMVMVQSFERVPQVNAECGSVVVLSTNKGPPSRVALPPQSFIAHLDCRVVQESSRWTTPGCTLPAWTSGPRSQASSTSTAADA